MADNYCACNGGEDAEYIIELNQQGPPGVQGEQGEQGYSPVVSYTVNNDTIQFTLVNEDTTSTTPNFYNYVAKKSVVDNHGILIQNNTDAIDNLQLVVNNHTTLIQNKLDKNGSNAYDPCIINNIKFGNAPSGYGGAISLSNAGKLLISNGGTATQENRAELQLGTTGTTLFGNNVVTIQSSTGINLYTLGKAYYKQYGNASSEIATIGDIGNGTITLTQGGVTKGTFTTNQSGNTTIELDAGGGAITNPLIIEDEDSTYSLRMGITTINQTRQPFMSFYTSSASGVSIELINSATAPIKLNELWAGLKTIALNYDNDTLKVNQDGQLYADIQGIQNPLSITKEDSGTTYTYTTGFDSNNKYYAQVSKDDGTDTSTTVIPSIYNLNDGTGINISVSSATSDANFTNIKTYSIDVDTNIVALKTDIPSLTGYATEQWVGQQGYITGITSSDVTTALGYTPYNSTNPNGYTSNVGTVTSVNNTQPDANGDVTITIPDVSNYYTQAQVDALLQAKQDLIDALTARVTALETNINGGNA